QPYQLYANEMCYKVDPLGQPTSSAHPKRFGLLLTQQPRPVL
uniref:Nucleolar protein 10 n=1 Tax=Esox lucius TaxID=8010 RepID=A0A6Q2Y450_ESOLU